MKWLEKDQQLLAMTDNVDYDVEGTSLVKSRLICHIIRQTHIHTPPCLTALWLVEPG